MILKEAMRYYAACLKRLELAYYMPSEQLSHEQAAV